MDNEDEGARLTRREENRELIAKHRAEVEMLAESIVERATVATPITDAVVKMMESGWLSLGSSAPGAVKPLIETMEQMERELIDLKQRLLPQYLGRAQRAEHERDALLEQLIAARSATAAPVAWMYEENGENMFGHPDGYRPKDAVPLYAQAPPVEEKAIGHARYEYVRTIGCVEIAINEIAKEQPK